MNLDNYSTINQTQKHERTSDRYSLVTTRTMLDILADHGWHPSKIQQAGTRVYDGYQKHIVRLRNESLFPVVLNEYHPELVLINSHMGSSAFQLMAGIYRLVCMNGLIVGESYAKESVRHTGFAEPKAISAIERVVRQLPNAVEQVETFRSITLNDQQREAYASAAIELIKDEEGKFSYNPRSFLSIRRWQDKDDTSLWGTMNVVQENVIRGGVRRIEANGRRTHTRQVKSLDKDTALNRALWSLTERMASLVSAH